MLQYFFSLMVLKTTKNTKRENPATTSNTVLNFYSSSSSCTAGDGKHLCALPGPVRSPTARSTAARAGPAAHQHAPFSSSAKARLSPGPCIAVFRTTPKVVGYKFWQGYIFWHNTCLRFRSTRWTPRKNDFIRKSRRISNSTRGDG